MARTGDLAELRGLVERHARTEGRHPSLLPELMFVRSHRPTAVARARATSLLLCVIVQGKKVSRFEGRELVYDAESYLVVTGELAYESQVVEASPARPYLTMLLQMPVDVVVETLLSMGEPAAAPPEPAAAYVSRLDPVLIDALCRLVRTLDDAEERRVLAPLVMEELVFRLLRSTWAAELRRQAARDEDQTRVARAMAFMQANLGRRLSVAAIARHVAMSPSHFAHRFRDVARTSPMTYLKHLRLLEARTLLLGDGLRPAEVASRVGYASATHFHRDFKQRFALPPAAYCRRFRGSQDPISASQARPSR